MEKEKFEELLAQKEEYQKRIADIKNEQVKVLRDLEGKVFQDLRNLINEKVPFINEEYQVTLEAGPLIGYTKDLTIYFDPLNELYRATEHDTYYATTEDIVQMRLFSDAFKNLRDTDKYLERFNDLLTEALYIRTKELDHVKHKLKDKSK